MPRAGLSTESVVRAAADLLDSHPGTELTLADLAAHLGVRAPSLYNHVAGLDDLQRRVAMHGIAELGDTLRSAVMGRSGGDAVRSLAYAYRGYVIAHPDVYPLTQQTRPDDPEYASLGMRVVEPVRAALTGSGVTETSVIHHVRAVRSALHGFALLETQQGFGLDVDVDASFDRLVDMLVIATVESLRVTPG